MKRLNIKKIFSASLNATLGLIAPGVAFSESSPQTTTNLEQSAMISLTANTSVSRIVNAPAFNGFGQFIFPMESSLSLSNMTLGNIQSLLPYHTNIRIQSTIDVIRYLQDESLKGNRVFYDIYSDKEKASYPAKNRTGLFFFKGRPNAPFAIICAGGGFSYVGSIHESMPLAPSTGTQ
jgi:hypothetical protein